MHKALAALIVGIVIGFLGWCWNGLWAWFPVAIAASLIVVGIHEANKRSIRKHRGLIDGALDRPWGDKHQWRWDDDAD